MEYLKAFDEDKIKAVGEFINHYKGLQSGGQLRTNF
jgi:hypothetical protein